MTGKAAEPNQEVRVIRGHVPPKSHIIAIAGGKGGVGKSFFSSNLGIFLGNMGYQTLLVDLDLGAANLHTCLGVGLPELGLKDLLTDSNVPLSSVMTDTPIPKLKLISGCNDPLEMASLDVQQTSRIMSSIYHLPADYIILDLSAGTHNTTLDFFLMAQSHIIVMTPEPSSIENAYRFMKASFYRKIRRYSEVHGVNRIVSEIMANPLENQVRSPADLLTAVQRKDKEGGARLVGSMQSLRFNLVINQIRTPHDVLLGESTRSVCQRYFGLPTQNLGQLDYDNAVWQSLRRKKPLLLEYPHSRLYAQLMKIARLIAQPQIKRAAV